MSHPIVLDTCTRDTDNGYCIDSYSSGYGSGYMFNTEYNMGSMDTLSPVDSYAPSTGKSLSSQSVLSLLSGYSGLTHFVGLWFAVESRELSQTWINEWSDATKQRQSVVNGKTILDASLSLIDRTENK